MANQLKMAKIQAILGLHERGWRNRRIARELRVDRETVAKYVRAEACAPKPANAPLGSERAGELSWFTVNWNSWWSESAGMGRSGGWFEFL
jgi:orotate phosphoribosyltransferase-like protein